MITTENITIGTRQFQRTKSDTYMIRQIETGNVYQEAVDIIPCAYTYEETDTLLFDESEEAAEADYQAALAELGVAL